MKKGMRVKSLTGKTKGMVGIAQCYVKDGAGKYKVAVTFSYGIGKRTYWFKPDSLRVLKDAKANRRTAGCTTTT